MTDVPDPDRRRAASGSGAARWCSSSTTRTARTRATSRMAAEWVTREAINFMLRWARGLVCMPCDGERLDAARASADGARPTRPAATPRSPCRSTTATPGAASVRADRALTIRASLDPASRPERLRAGPATCSRCAPAPAACSSAAATPRPPSTSPGSPGCAPVAVICEVLHDDGSPGPLPVPRAVRAGAPHRDDLGRRRSPSTAWRRAPPTAPPRRSSSNTRREASAASRGPSGPARKAPRAGLRVFADFLQG